MFNIRFFALCGIFALGTILGGCELPRDELFDTSKATKVHDRLYYAAGKDYTTTTATTKTCTKYHDLDGDGNWDWAGVAVEECAKHGVK